MPDPVRRAGLVWNATEQAALRRLAEFIIGADPEGVMPGVADPEILARILERAVNFERPLRRGIECLTQTTADLTAIADERLGPHLNSRPELRSLLRAMMQVVAQVYYQDPRVLAALDLPARPPFPDGHQVETGDWSLLDPVRKRGRQAD